MTKRSTMPPRIDDADIDVFVAQWIKHLPAMTAEKRADFVYDGVIALLHLTQPEKSSEWVKEFARRVRARVLWMMPENIRQRKEGDLG